MIRFPHYKQADQKDCGPTCLSMVAKYFGKEIQTRYLRKLAETTREGTSLLGLSETAEKIGFHTIAARINFAQLAEVPLPCIVHYNKVHYVVVYKIKKDFVYISDPAHGKLKQSKESFLKLWIGNNANENTEEGIVLLIEPTPRFYSEEIKLEESDKFDYKYIVKYLIKYKRFIFQLAIGLLAGSLLQLIVPFLTQSIVDVGIKNKDINFVYLILIAQLFLFFGRTALEIIRGWITLHLSTRINISIISDFFYKLMKLPISYFDSKMTGDLMQRIHDHKRIENILTTSSLTVLFSMVNFFIFGFVLAYYSLQIFGIFLVGSSLYFAWILFFFKRRKKLDYLQFGEVSQEQSKVIELINGMQEIKLHNAEKQMRWNWEYIQARLYKVAIKSLRLEQTQSVGSSFITQLKDILITVLSAKLVIDGEITLGMMLAITYIVGQLDSPISQLIGFLRSAQDAKIALERLGEIHNMKDEEDTSEQKITSIPQDIDVKLHGVFFRYPGGLEPVIKDLNLTIPANKVTAIVGASGSGKTTLMKLLLKFYELNNGNIHIDGTNLNNISQKAWRDYCGSVMQEGYIFNDSIAKNIAVGSDFVDQEKLIHAVKIANIKLFIDELPLGFNTKIGSEGTGLSTGQKQRLLIARAVYKNPKFLLFDEATSALDANNERVIMENLNLFFENKTVVIVAHRLSTVKNAHQIVVLDKGKIVEQGNHKELTRLKGSYYHLVKNQLELGN